MSAKLHFKISKNLQKKPDRNSPKLTLYTPQAILDELVYVPETTHKIRESLWKKPPMKKKLNLSKIFSNNSSSSKSLKAKPKLFGMPNFTDDLFKAPPSTSR